MGHGNENAPIIIKKGKKHHGHHGGAWKVAYADFVTAMMALFIVLWILGQDKEVIENVAGYFRDPLGFTDKVNSIINGNGPSLQLDSIKVATMDKEARRQQEIAEFKKMGDKILGELQSNPEFSGLADQVKIEVVDEGLRIEMMESNNDVFFEIGTSQLNPRAKNLVEKIGKNLATISNKIIIEGHTDSRPYSGGNAGYSNYELSCDRANSARRVLLSSGLQNERIDEIRGYADTRLSDKEDPFSVVNRRVSIIIKFATEEPK